MTGRTNTVSSPPNAKILRHIRFLLPLRPGHTPSPSHACPSPWDFGKLPWSKVAVDTHAAQSENGAGGLYVCPTSLHSGSAPSRSLSLGGAVSPLGLRGKGSRPERRPHEEIKWALGKQGLRLFPLGLPLGSFNFDVSLKPMTTLTPCDHRLPENQMTTEENNVIGGRDWTLEEMGVWEGEK